MEAEFSELEKKIGYRFKNPELLKRALTHRSFAFENSDFLIQSFLYLRYCQQARTLEAAILYHLYNGEKGQSL